MVVWIKRHELHIVHHTKTLKSFFIIQCTFILLSHHSPVEAYITNVGKRVVRICTDCAFRNSVRRRHICGFHELQIWHLTTRIIGSRYTAQWIRLLHYLERYIYTEYACQISIGLVFLAVGSSKTKLFEMFAINRNDNTYGCCISITIHLCRHWKVKLWGTNYHKF